MSASTSLHSPQKHCPASSGPAGRSPGSHCPDAPGWPDEAGFPPGHRPQEPFCLRPAQWQPHAPAGSRPSPHPVWSRKLWESRCGPNRHTGSGRFSRYRRPSDAWASWREYTAGIVHCMTFRPSSHFRRNRAAPQDNLPQMRRPQLLFWKPPPCAPRRMRRSHESGRLPQGIHNRSGCQYQNPPAGQSAFVRLHPFRSAGIHRRCSSGSGEADGLVLFHPSGV